MSTSQSLPTSMPAWQFSAIAGGLEANLKLNQVAPVPKLPSNSSASNPSTLVRVLSASINPVEYKLAEIPVVGRLAYGGFPATPGIDYVGRVWSTTDPALKPGDIVFGKFAGPQNQGTLGGYIVIKGTEYSAKPPANFDIANRLEELGCVGIVGLTSYQCFTQAGFTTEGSGQGQSVFINGGSGGTGTFGIQIAKHCLGFSHVVASCSGANVDLVKSLGADEVIDYRSSNVIETLTTQTTKNGKPFDLIIDNAGYDPNLYWRCGAYLSKQGKYVQVGAPASFGTVVQMMKFMLWPSILGGGQRKWAFLALQDSRKDLKQLGKWMGEGKLKTVVDSRFEMDEVPKAYERLKTGRCRGKVVVRVAEQ